jgi:hypothetical protein
MNKKKLFENPNVTLVGEGLKRVNGKIQYDENGKPIKAIVIGVAAKKSVCELNPKEVLPKKIGWIRKKKTDVIETGVIRAYKEDYQRKVRPVVMGISGGHPDVTAGTIGFINRATITAKANYLRKNPKKEGLFDWLWNFLRWLFGIEETMPDPEIPDTTNSREADVLTTNNHIGSCSIVDENGNAVCGDPFLQQAAYDGGKISGNTIGNLLAYVNLYSNKSNFVDTSMIELKQDIPFEKKIFGTDIPIGDGIVELELGDTVFKQGRTTGLTYGIVTVVKSTQRVWFDEGILTFADQVVIEGLDGKPFSAGGDSGSGVWKIINGIAYAAGLLFAGSDSDGITIINRIANVKKAYQNLGIIIHGW